MYLFNTDAANNPHHLALLAYCFPGNFIPSAQKHGNSKCEQPFFPTWPSYKEMIKSECQTSSPKQAIHCVSEKIGGLMSSSCPMQLPRNERQARYSKSVATCSKYNPADKLYSVMFHAKQEDASCTFICDIRVLPDPAIVLASDYQLHDLVRFGTDSTEHCILTVHSTFSLGEFDVTPVTYRHLLLESRHTGKPPICVGPILIHYRKTFPTCFLFLA